MPSAVIRRFVYDETAGNLWVEFTTGRRYVYSDVPHEVADAFRGIAIGAHAAAPALAASRSRSPRTAASASDTVRS